MDGHVYAFAFFGGVPQSVLCDNDRCLVSKIQPDGTRVGVRCNRGRISPENPKIVQMINILQKYDLNLGAFEHFKKRGRHCT
jgi:hypothetical protein